MSVWLCMCLFAVVSLVPFAALNESLLMKIECKKYTRKISQWYGRIEVMSTNRRSINLQILGS